MTADDVRPYLRIDDETAEETHVLSRLIAAARLQVEHDSGLLLLPQVWTVTRMYWPREPYIILPAMPARTVERLSYATDAGAFVLEPGDYVLELVEDRYSRVSLAMGSLAGQVAWCGRGCPAASAAATRRVRRTCSKLCVRWWPTGMTIAKRQSPLRPTRPR